LDKTGDERILAPSCSSDRRRYKPRTQQIGIRVAYIYRETSPMRLTAGHYYIHMGGVAGGPQIRRQD